LFAGAFALVALALGFWSIAERPGLLGRDDNARNVIAERQIRRGTIFDRNGAILAETDFDADGFAVRSYPRPETAAVVGYYSLRYGLGGAEDLLDSTLRGVAYLTPSQTFLNQLLHRPQLGGDARLTLDTNAQQAAMAGLGSRRGAVVAIDAVNG